MEDRNLSESELEKIVGGISAQTLFSLADRKEVDNYLRKNRIAPDSDDYNTLMSMWERYRVT